MLVGDIGGGFGQKTSLYPEDGIVAYAATSGGYSAAPMVNAMDTVLGGLSTSAAQIIDPEYVVSPVANFYFNFISMFVVAGAITLVTELLLSKRADAMELDPLDEDDPEAFDVKMALDAKEKRGVLFAVITIVVCAAILFFLALPADVHADLGAERILGDHLPHLGHRGAEIDAAPDPKAKLKEIGRASCRERV